MKFWHFQQAHLQRTAHRSSMACPPDGPKEQPMNKKKHSFRGVYLLFFLLPIKHFFFFPSAVNQEFLYLFSLYVSLLATSIRQSSALLCRRHYFLPLFPYRTVPFVSVLVRKMSPLLAPANSVGPAMTSPIHRSASLLRRSYIAAPRRSFPKEWCAADRFFSR